MTYSDMRHDTLNGMVPGMAPTPIRSRARRLLALAALFAPLAACTVTDPLEGEGLWKAQHVNRANLVLMAANPADLVRGQGEAGSDGVLAAAAIDRLYNNKLKRLPALQTTKVIQAGGGEE